MNKLGFYVENTTTPFLRDALREVRPPTLLVHAGDRGLLREIRRDLSPDTFVVGRMFIPLSEQEAWLNDPDPAGKGRALADRVLSYDMGFATERGANGRLLIDAWMGMNECLRGPASFPDGRPDAETLRRADALDRFQVAFRTRLSDAGLEAVAFNFGAGNFTQPSHYVNLFPLTLASYTYLGFHEYGWPTLIPRAGSATAALLYRRCMDGIRQRFGKRHKVIITEAGLARMYRYPNDPAGDVGWLYPDDQVSEDQYWEALSWYNTELLRDAYALGACLFSVGHSGRWETFRLLGNDNQGRPILLMSRIASLGAAPAPPPRPEPTPAPAPVPSVATLRKRLTAVESYLKLTLQQTSRLRGIHDQIRTTIAGLLRATGELPDDVALTSCAHQLANLDAALERLAVGASGISYPPHLAQLKWRIARLRQGLDEVRQDIQKAEALRAEVEEVGAALDATERAYQVVPNLDKRARDMTSEAQAVRNRLGPARWAAADRLPFTDIAAQLPAHRSKRFATRDVGDIRWVIVHHTGVGADTSLETLARAVVSQGLPGLPFHFVVGTDGGAFQVQPLTAQLGSGSAHSVEARGVSVALAGTFDRALPSEDQLDGLSALVLWLLSQHDLGADAVFGASEMGAPTTSPGIQWLQGYQYKLVLLERLAGSDLQGLSIEEPETNGGDPPPW